MAIPGAKEVKNILNPIQTMMNNVSFLNPAVPRQQAKAGDYAPKHQKARDEALSGLGAQPKMRAKRRTADSPDADEAQNDVYGAQAQQPRDAGRADTPDDPQGTVSICLDSVDTMPGIAGILEGFGLLTGETDGPVNEGAETLLDMEAAAQGALQASDESLPSIIGELMPPDDGDFGQVQDTHSDTLENPNIQAANQPEAPATRADSFATVVDTAIDEAAVVRPVNDAAEDIRTDEKSDETGDDAQLLFPSAVGRERQAMPADIARQRPVQAVSPADMRDNFVNIVQSFTSAAVDGHTEFTVSLKPEFLGELSIRLVMEDSGIRAQIQASDAAAKGLIQSELPTLLEQLREKGLMVTQVEVSYEAPQFDLNGRQRGYEGDNGRGDGGRAPVLGAAEAERLFELTQPPYDAGAYASPYDLYGALPEGSSVRFTA